MNVTELAWMYLAAVPVRRAAVTVLCRGYVVMHTVCCYVCICSFEYVRCVSLLTPRLQLIVTLRTSTVVVESHQLQANYDEGEDSKISMWRRVVHWLQKRNFSCVSSSLCSFCWSPFALSRTTSWPMRPIRLSPRSSAFASLIAVSS